MSATTAGPRPEVLPIHADGVSPELKAAAQWVAWGFEQRDDRWTKPPLSPVTGKHASSTEPETWATFADALRFAHSRQLAGVGVVVTRHDGWVGLDFDKCRDPQTGEIAPWAQAVIDRFGSYSEISPSGTGVRIFIRTATGLLPGGEDGRRKGPVEIYGVGRYFTVTGHRLSATHEIAERTDELAAFCAELWPAASPKSTPSRVGSAVLSDDEIIERARLATNASKFMRLWAGDTSEYGGDDSAADLALLGILSFYSQDRDQLDRLFRRSGLYREKWERADYRRRTIDRAMERSEVYEPIGRNGATPLANRSHSGRTGNSAVDEAPPQWEAPEPLPVDEQPEFPVDSLAKTLSSWVKALATATQTPPALAAMMTDGAIAIACAKRVEVEVRPGWREPVNTYNQTALESGNRKSAVAQAVEAPFKRVARLRAAEMAPEVAKARAKRDVVEKRLERLKKQQAAQPVSDLAIDADIHAAIAELLSSELRVPVAPQYLVDDVTPEKLADLMGEHGERMGVLSAEGGIFQIIAGRYSDGRADGLDLFLKGHSGDSLPIDRIGRETKHLDAPALSLVLAPQPDVLRGLSRRPGFRGRGLLARFDYAVPRSTVGRRTIAADPISDDIRAAYERLIAALLALPNPDAAPPPGPGSSGDSVNASGPITLSEEAAERFVDFEAWLEPQLDREDGALGDIQDWASKLAGRVARWAARSHVVQHVRAGEQGAPSALTSHEIDAETIDAAITIAKAFLIPHAKTAFAMMSADQTENRARRVLYVVRSWPQDTITRRDVWRRVCRSFTAVDDLDRPLGLLVEHGYLRPLPNVATGPGRKPSPTFAINPHCQEKETANGGTRTRDGVDTSTRTMLASEFRESVDRIDRNRVCPESVDSVNGFPGHQRARKELAGTAPPDPDWTHAEVAETGFEEFTV